MPPSTRPLSLAALTVIELSPPDMVSVAAEAGFQHLGLRVVPATPQERAYPLLGDTPMVREIRRRLADGAISLLDVEVFRLKPETRVQDFRPAIETAAALGAKHLLTTGQDADTARLVDRYNELCELAAAFGLTVDLEFMPWTEISNIASACAVLSKANCANGGLIVDALHFNRTGATLDELGAVPRAWLHFAQLCDARREAPSTFDDLIFEARNARLLPGEGDLDLVSLVNALPADVPISVEVPSAGSALSAFERARRACDAARAVLARADASRR